MTKNNDFNDLNISHIKKTFLLNFKIITVTAIGHISLHVYITFYILSHKLTWGP